MSKAWLRRNVAHLYIGAVVTIELVLIIARGGQL